MNHPQSGTSSATSELRGYLPTLDGWRAVAILFVIVFHARDSMIRVFGTPMAWFAPWMSLWGPFGVDLFFAISGLLITSRLMAEETKLGRINLKSFYIRRAFRILPPSLTFLAAVLVLGLTGVIAFNLRSWFAALFFYVNYIQDPLWYVGHFWSLAVEEHFYAFWPALLVFVPRGRRVATGLCLCLLVLVWRLLNFKFAAIGIAMGSTYFTHQGRTDFQLDGILWGATMALAFSAISWRWPRWVLGLPFGSALLVLVLLSLHIFGHWKLAQALLLFRKIAVPLILLTTITNCRGIVERILESRILRSIGRLSYSLYLWQQLFLVWGVQLLAKVPWAQRFPINILCAFACATASYYLLEKPFIRLGHRIAARTSQTQPVQTTV
jgi:peptidoglycan/LPS O-acetylase OafA/YrhL